MCFRSLETYVHARLLLTTLTALLESLKVLMKELVGIEVMSASTSASTALEHFLASIISALEFFVA